MSPCYVPLTLFTSEVLFLWSTYLIMFAKKLCYPIDYVGYCNLIHLFPFALLHYFEETIPCSLSKTLRGVSYYSQSL